MATVGTIVANLVANTTKFTNGFKKAKDSIHSVQMQMTGLNQVIKQQQDKFVKLSGSVSDALAAEAERAKQRKAIAIKTEVVVGQARVKAMQMAERGLAAARFAEIRASEMKALRLRQFYARKQEEAIVGGPMFGKRFIGAGKKAFGALGLGAGLAGEALGGESVAGRAAGAVGNIAGSAALGGLTLGPWGAAIFGGVTALKEFKGALDQSTETVKEWRKWQKEQVDNAVAHRAEAVGQVRSLREQFFPDVLTESQARHDILETIKANNRLAISGEKSGLTKKDQQLLQAQTATAFAELEKFDQRRTFRDSGAQGLRALFQSRVQLGANAAQIGRNLLGQANAGLAGLRGGIFEGQIERFAGTRDRARDLARGSLGEFAEASRQLRLALGLSNEERRAGLLQAFEELKDKTGLTQISDASGPLKGTNEALDEILRVTRENPTEKLVLDVAEAQLEEQKHMAEKLARELERLGVAGIKQANF